MGRLIMVVDDSATVRKFVAASLTMQGFTVVAACDGMDALEKLPSGTFDLVITDLNMPNMDGFEFIRSLRENPITRDVPVIILSSLGDLDSMARGRELGVQSYLMKPFSLEKIQYEVSKYISWAD
ncbi:MAG TPA: response regulator [Bacteroidota bacterium]|nr:response regulator [Bacteroidota bacterium]